LGIQVVEKEEIKVVGISWNGTYSQAGSIPELFSKLEQHLEDIPYKTNEPVLIAPFHNRETELTYYVTTPVEQIEEVPEGLVGFTIPRKNYVCTSHVGRPEDIEKTYSRLHTWMEEYGYERDYQALSLEVYKEEYRQDNVSGNLYFEIYLPVKIYK